jgi:glycosyltransferase involved in cell wall biosynthesis
VDWLPHGIDTSVFYPRPRPQARHSFGNRLKTRWFKGPKRGEIMNIPDDAFVIGIVATNQARKDWGLAFRTIAELKKDRRVFAWCKTDRMEHIWSLPALINDFDLRDETVVTVLDYRDEDMAWAYSACDVTLGIGTGEGFGYPIFESLACGTPCIHGNDGGAPEHIPPAMLVNAECDRIEGPYNAFRRVYSPYEWRDAVLKAELLWPKHPASILAEYLDWNNLWPRWAEWLRAGVK